MIMKRVRNQARQGDVFVVRTKRKATGTEAPRENGRVVLAHGEATGHCHAIRDPGVCMLRAEGITMLAVSRGAEALIEHEEHGSIALAPGNWEVRRQREYGWAEEASHVVAD